MLQGAAAAGITQLCPRAGLLTQDQVAAARATGFTLRAWGISNDEVRTVTNTAMVSLMSLHVMSDLALAAFHRGSVAAACNATVCCLVSGERDQQLPHASYKQHGVQDIDAYSCICYVACCAETAELCR